jgi:hypothetical protein
MAKKKLSSGGKEVTRNPNISEEDVESLKKLSSVSKYYEYIDDEKKEQYPNLSAREIRKIIKVNDCHQIGHLLQLRKDLSVKFLNSIYKKNRKIGFFEFAKSSPSRKNDLTNDRIEILANLAVHPKTNHPLLKKLSKDKEPAIRLSTTENSKLPKKARLRIYQDLVSNAGYGDNALFLKTLYKRDMPVYLLNNGLRSLFQTTAFVTVETRLGSHLQFEEEIYEESKPEYPDHTNYKSFYDKNYQADREKYLLFRQREEKQYAFRNLLQGITYLDGMSLETTRTILESGHPLSILFLHTNKNHPAEIFEALVEYRDYFDENYNPLKEPHRDLQGLAANPAVPAWILGKIVEIAMPDLSYKRLGSAYSNVAYELSANPSTPLESLLTLHSLHNMEAAEKEAEPGGAYYAGETSGTPFALWRRIEDNPTFLKWKAENPNYQELLPPVILCTCHGL